jgi:hypothetical protein
MLHGIVRLDDGFGDYRLQATCDKCSHVRMIEPQTLAKILGWHALLSDAAARLRCSKCGARGCRLTAQSRPKKRGRVER